MTLPEHTDPLTGLPRDPHTEFRPALPVTELQLAVDRMRNEVRAIYEASWSSAEYAEGVAAFLDKRTPDFRAARRPV